jgi:hypothetical protein
VVPVWFQSLRFQKEFGSRMAPTFAAGVLSFVLSWWCRDLLTDWLALLQVEGRLESAAARFLAGEVFYRNFAFSDVPGAVLVQALAQTLGIASRYFYLMAASASVAMVFHWSANWGAFARSILLLLLVTWSFSLWNISEPSWIALSFALAGIGSMRSGRWALAGLFFGVTFWFHQQMGIAAIGGAALFVFLYMEGWVLPLVAVGLIVIPVIGIHLTDPALLSLAIGQIDWLPGQPLRNLPKQVIGAPLVVLGLWVLSLYFFRSTQKLRGFSILAVLAYAMVGWMREGRSFLLGCFFLFSVLVWLVVPALALRLPKEDRKEIFLVWLPAALFCLLFSGDFPPFLQLFPLVAYFLVWILHRLRALYGWLPRAWFFAPALLLLLGGVVHQSRLFFLRAYAATDSIGRQSFGEVSQVSRELAALKEFLVVQNPQEGILVLPSAPYLYPYIGIRNLSPFDVVTESTFAPPASLLSYYQSGGKYLVIQGDPPAFLSAEIREKFSLAQSFGRFSVWRFNRNEN